MNSVAPLAGKAKTGIWGLDDILSGGFSRGHLFLLEGAPGTGKTTIALQFLLEGARAGEKGLYITLSETERELRAGAASHGWTLGDGIEVFELHPCRRFALALADDDARLGASAIRYFFTVGLFHSFQLAGVTGARRPP